MMAMDVGCTMQRKVQLYARLFMHTTQKASVQQRLSTKTEASRYTYRILGFHIHPTSGLLCQMQTQHGQRALHVLPTSPQNSHHA